MQKQLNGASKQCCGGDSNSTPHRTTAFETPHPAENNRNTFITSMFLFLFYFYFFLLMLETWVLRHRMRHQSLRKHCGKQSSEAAEDLRKFQHKHWTRMQCGGPQLTQRRWLKDPRSSMPGASISLRDRHIRNILWPCWSRKCWKFNIFTVFTT